MKFTNFTVNFQRKIYKFTKIDNLQKKKKKYAKI